MSNDTIHNELNQRSLCPEDKQLLLYVQNKLDSKAHRKVELHLTDCEICSDIVDGLIETGQDRIIQQKALLDQEIDNRVESKNQTSVSKPIFRWYYAAAAIVILGLSSIFYTFYLSEIKEQPVADVPTHETTMPENPVPVSLDSTSKMKTQEDSNENNRDSKWAENTQQNLLNSSDHTNADSTKYIPYTQGETSIQTVVANNSGASVMNDENSTLVTQDMPTPKQETENYEHSDHILTKSASSIKSSKSNKTKENSALSLDVISIEKKAPEDPPSMPQKQQNYSGSIREKNIPTLSSAESNISIREEENSTHYKAYSLMRKGKHKEAITELNLFLTDHPQDCRAMHALTECYEQVNDSSDFALKSYENLADASCGKWSGEALLKLVQLYTIRKENNKAKLVLERALQSKYKNVVNQAQELQKKLK